MVTNQFLGHVMIHVAVMYFSGCGIRLACVLSCAHWDVVSVYVCIYIYTVAKEQCAVDM